MHGTRSATACTNSQFSGQLRFGPCGECCRFFMTIVNPLNFFVLTNLFGNAVEGISNHTVYALHACEYQLVYNFCCDRFCHVRSEEHTSELQSLMRISYAVFCLTKKI